MMLLWCKLSRPRTGGWKARLKNWFGGLLWAFGKSYYCHTEIEFSDGQAFSSEPPNGPRFDWLDFNAGEWDGWFIDATPDQEAAMRARAIEIKGRGYDAIGLGSFLTKAEVIRPSNTKFWCSEACTDVAQRGGFFGSLTADHTTPDDMAEWASANLRRAMIK